MLAKISLTAAFFLLTAPPIACASNRDASNPAPITCHVPESQPAFVLAQDGQPSIGTSDNGNDSDSDGDASDSDNDSDSNDDSDANQNGDDNQNADGSQMNGQNAAGDDQPARAGNGGDNDQNDSVPQFNQPPQQQPATPY